MSVHKPLTTASPTDDDGPVVVQGNGGGYMSAKDKKRVLLAGESWVTTATHIKGFDQFNTATYHLGADRLVAALTDASLTCCAPPRVGGPSNAGE